MRDLDDDRITPPGSPQDRRHPRSTPASPAVRKKSSRNQSSSPIRHLLNSPLLNRRQKKKQSIESSDDESSSGLQNSEENVRKHYRNLETFQKAQLRQKVESLHDPKKKKKYAFFLLSLSFFSLNVEKLNRMEHRRSFSQHRYVENLLCITKLQCGMRTVKCIN